MTIPHERPAPCSNPPVEKQRLGDEQHQSERHLGGAALAMLPSRPQKA